MVGEILVAERDPHYSLGQQVEQLVEDLILFAPILEAGRDAREQIQGSAVSRNSTPPASEVMSPPSRLQRAVRPKVARTCLFP